MNNALNDFEKQALAHVERASKELHLAYSQLALSNKDSDVCDFFAQQIHYHGNALDRVAELFKKTAH